MVDESDERTRQLPLLYMGKSPIFAARNVPDVVERLILMIEVIRAVSKVPTYLFTACEFRGRKGLWGRDFFNRSAYRRKMEREGMRFSDHPVTYFNENRMFYSEGWDEFVPEFVILRKDLDYPEEHKEVIRTHGAALAFHVCSYRLQTVGTDELKQLMDVVQAIDGLSGRDPTLLVEELNSGVRS